MQKQEKSWLFCFVARRSSFAVPAELLHRYRVSSIPRLIQTLPVAASAMCEIANPSLLGLSR